MSVGCCEFVVPLGLVAEVLSVADLALGRTQELCEGIATARDAGPDSADRATGDLGCLGVRQTDQLGEQNCFPLLER